MKSIGKIVQHSATNYLNRFIIYLTIFSVLLMTSLFIYSHKNQIRKYNQMFKNEFQSLVTNGHYFQIKRKVENLTILDDIVCMSATIKNIPSIQYGPGVEKHCKLPPFSFLLGKTRQSIILRGFQREKLGQIYYVIKMPPPFILIIAILFFVALCLLLSRRLGEKLQWILTANTAPLVDLGKTLSEGKNYNLTKLTKAPKSREIYQILDSISVFQKKIKSIQKQELDQALKEKAIESKLDMAKQVAHDIRSPLAALEMVAGHLQNLSEDNRNLIRSATQRISEIASSLLSENQLQNKESTIGPTLIAPILNRLSLEKTSLFQNNTTLEVHTNKENFGLFGLSEAATLQRVLSNILNNSFESILDQGTIDVKFWQEGHHLFIRIVDTGKGISEEILNQLMQKGASFGKVGGLGLGLYHAKKSIERWKGNIQIKSKLNVGTEVLVQLQNAPPPNWFKNRIDLNGISNIVIADDDPSIHELWKTRFFDLKAMGLKLHHAQNLNQLEKILAPLYLNQTLYLIDYEFMEEPTNGLQFIQEHRLLDHTYLVTSHFDNLEIQNKCKGLGVYLLPKSLAAKILLL